MSSTYYLFNYIQQEDNIYFLRKNEDEKGNSLAFLFNIESEEAERLKLLEIKNNLNSQQALIGSELRMLTESVSIVQAIDYVNLFPNQDFEFDQEAPFQEIDTAKLKLDSFQDELSQLISLKNSFSPDDYDKSIKHRDLNHNVISNSEILNALLIKDIYSNEIINDLERINSKINKAKAFLQTRENDFISKDYFSLFLSNPDQFQEYLLLEDGIKRIDEELGTLGRIFSELNLNRQRVIEEFNKIKGSEHVSDSQCPLCNTDFESFESLRVAIDMKSRSLEAYNSEKLRDKSNLEDRIKLFHSRIKESALTFLDNHEVTEQSIISLLREYPNLQQRVEKIINDFSIFRSPEMSEFYFVNSPNTFSEINARRDLLRVYLEENLLPQYEYNDMSIEGKGLYVRYFNADRSKFSALTTEMLEAKSQYLSGVYAQLVNQRITFLQSRLDKLSRLVDHINSIYSDVHNTIREHKAEMIEKIKIPFYIYSGKIIQSYQQGLGIFIEIHSTSGSNHIRFKTGHHSDHDIVYHLSSGQMAVVSLAFCLSLNKVYNTNENFKFLAIDDPVQTMDDLNIHTFIELIRNEFKDYQVIISTHDDFTSRYMKYKFDKFSIDTKIHKVQSIVLQSLFES